MGSFDIQTDTNQYGSSMHYTGMINQSFPESTVLYQPQDIINAYSSCCTHV